MRQYCIENDHFKVEVNHKGAEIASIKSKKSDVEYMWQADPTIWGSHAPVLFPAIGSFKNNNCTIDGQVYKIPKHGFIRHNEDLIVKKHDDQSLVLGLKYSEKTLGIFPYQFAFKIIFSLHKNELTVAHEIVNLDDKPIHFSLGGHPAFRCPWHDGESYSNYFIEFDVVENAETTLLSPEGLITNKTEKMLENTNILPLTDDLFNNDALIFKDLKSRKVALKNKQSKQALTVSFQDFNYLGIWAKPKAPFVCIEPWLGIADHEDTDGDYLKKDGLITLKQGKVFTAQFSIKIEE